MHDKMYALIDRWWLSVKANIKTQNQRCKLYLHNIVFYFVYLLEMSKDDTRYNWWSTQFMRTQNSVPVSVGSNIQNNLSTDVISEIRS